MPQKTSKKARDLREQIESSKGRAEHLRTALGADFRALHELIDSQAASSHRQLLYELANLTQESAGYFSKRWEASSESEQQLLFLRDELRQLWITPDPRVVEKKLEEWILLAMQRNSELPWAPSLRLKAWIPRHEHFRGSLTAGVLEWYSLFRICANPTCAYPHFIARRRDQKYCEQGECTRYAQRQYAAANYQKKFLLKPESKKGGKQHGAGKKK